MKKFLKENVGEILFSIFLILAVVMMFLPFYEVVQKLKDASGESYKIYTDFSFINMVFGINSSVVTTNINILLLTSLIILFIGSLLFYIGRGLIKNHIKCSTVLSFISLSLVVISLFLILFSYYYIPLIDSNIASINGFKEINVISYSYGITLGSLIVMSLCILRRVFDKTHFTIYEISEMAMLVALALVLDKVKIPVGVTGGSINASAIPLFMIAIRYGPLKGLLCSSLIFGLISCLLDGYGIQTFPFDYLIAFSGYASVGLFFKLFKKHILDKNNAENSGNELGFLMTSIILGSVVSFITRMFGSSWSSVIFYDYSWSEAFLYNITYIPFAVFGSGAIACILAKPILVINKKFPIKCKAC